MFMDCLKLIYENDKWFHYLINHEERWRWRAEWANTTLGCLIILRKCFHSNYALIGKWIWFINCICLSYQANCIEKRGCAWIINFDKALLSHDVYAACVYVFVHVTIVQCSIKLYEDFIMIRIEIFGKAYDVKYWV